MFTGTTPTYTLTFEDIDLTLADSVAVTIADGTRNVLLELSGDDLAVTATTITFSLTQAQTLSLPKGNLLLQVNWIYNGGEARACSEIATIDFSLNLKNEVME